MRFFNPYTIQTGGPKQNKNAFYACVNRGKAGCSPKIVKRSVCIDVGMNEVIEALQ